MDTREGKKERGKEKWWRCADITREREKRNLERGNETASGVRDKDSLRMIFFSLFHFFYILAIEIIIIIIFFFFLVCELFFVDA